MSIVETLVQPKLTLGEVEIAGCGLGVYLHKFKDKVLQYKLYDYIIVGSKAITAICVSIDELKNEVIKMIIVEVSQDDIFELIKEENRILIVQKDGHMNSIGRA